MCHKFEVIRRHSKVSNTNVDISEAGDGWGGGAQLQP